MTKDIRRKNRNVSSEDLEEAIKLAHENGLTLRALSYANGDPQDINQYRIEGPGWFKDIYPGTQRLYCPDKAKQGPFVSMPFGKPWTIMDVVKACIATMRRTTAKAAAAEERAKTKAPLKPVVEPEDVGPTFTRKTICSLLDSIAKHEDVPMQIAMRDLMADLRHVSDRRKLNYHKANEESYDVYLEEKNDPDFRLEE